MNKVKVVLGIVGMIVGLYVIGFAMTGADYLWFKFWGQKYEDAKREIYEESQSHVQGTIRDLRNLKMEYKKAELGSAERQVVRETYLHRVADFDKDKLPDDLKSFTEKLKQRKLEE